MSPRCRGDGERTERRKDRGRKSQRVVAFSLDTDPGVTLSRSFLFNRLAESLEGKEDEIKGRTREFAIASFGKCETDLLSVERG